ncbi:hypothetical protein BV25DRAFT_1814475, partial [Artomyces pyxidatus]
RIYRHKVLRINYTTYDLRCAQDSINPCTHADIMVLSCEDDDGTAKHHYYWYAHVIGVYHANIIYTGPGAKTTEPQRMEFLWVRWFGRDGPSRYKSSWKAQAPHRVGFVDAEAGGAFGFLNPNPVIRAVHLIPAFHYGRTRSLLPPSIIRPKADNDVDYWFYYIGMYANFLQSHY